MNGVARAEMDGYLLVLSRELQVTSSQAAVALRNAVPQAQSTLLVSQPANGTLSFEQICYSKVSAVALCLEEEKGRWRDDVEIAQGYTYSAQRIGQDVGRIPKIWR